MKHKKTLILACIIVFLIGIVCSILMIIKPHGQTVQIIQNGEILYTINLEESDDQTIEVEYKGNRNIIQIQNHGICIIDAKCPDKTCVKMGELKSSATPIVCLPNKLVIKFVEKDDIDAEVK